MKKRIRRYLILIRKIQTRQKKKKKKKQTKQKTITNI